MSKPIYGDTVGGGGGGGIKNVPQSDWIQSDNTQLDFIKNKPTLGELAAKNEVSESELESALKEKINNIDNKVDGDTVDQKINDAFIKFTTDASDDETINTYKELIDSAATYAKEMSDLEARTTALEKWMADESYVPITASLKVNSSTSIVKEIGDTLTDATITWSTSKAASTIRFERPTGLAVSEIPSTDSNTYQAHEPMIDENGAIMYDVDGDVIYTYTYPCEKTWSLTVTEKDGKSDGTYATAGATAKLYFRHRVYWGVGTTESGFDSDFVKKLTNSELRTSKAATLNLLPDTQYIYYAVPKDLCGTEPTFIIDKGFAGGFKHREEIVVKNAYKVPIVYYVYRSDQLLVGSTRVDIS